MKRWFYNILLCVCVFAIIFGFSKIQTTTNEYKKADEEYETIKQVAKQKKKDGKEIDFQKLRTMNPDIVAWIRIPETNIDYPVVQGKDNEEYLNKTFTGEYNSSGTIFLDCKCNQDFSSENNVMYGHHMRNGSMFAELLNFRDTNFLKENNKIILYLPEKTLQLKVIFGYAAKAEKIPISFKDQEEKEKYLNRIITNSEILSDTDIASKKIFTFVTCSYEGADYRTYIHAMEE